MFEVGLVKHEERLVEMADFNASIDEAKQENRLTAANKLTVFNEYKDKVLWGGDGGHSTYICIVIYL